MTIKNIRQRPALLFFILAVLLFSCKDKTGKADQAVNDKIVPLRIAAYNVEFGDKGTPQEIGKMLSSYGFQIVCMSEVPGGDWAATVGKEMGLEYVTLGTYSTAGHEDKYKAILSQTPLYEIEEVLMADTLHTAVKAKTKINNREISLYSVHFPFGWRDQAHIDETDNKVKTFVDHLDRLRGKETAVIAGDFNFIPSTAEKGSKYHEMFKEIGFRLAGESVGMPYDSLVTMVGKKKRLGRVIDHVFYDPEQMDAVRAEIIELEKPLSDHKPVWAEFELK